MTIPASPPPSPSSRRARRGVAVPGCPGAVAGDPADLRGHCVSVRLSAAELTWLDEARRAVQMRRGEYLRCAAIGRLPPAPALIPALNRQAYGELGKAGANLMQLVHRLNERRGEAAPLTDLDLDTIRAAVVDLRIALIGATASVAPLSPAPTGHTEINRGGVVIIAPAPGQSPAS